LYSFVSQLLEPYTLVVVSSLLLCFAFWRSTRLRDKAGLVATICLALLFLISTPAAKHLALGSLEWRYVTGMPTPEPADTIVVLSGSHTVEDDEGKRVRLGDTTLNRCAYALRLYRRAGGCRLVLSGGKVDWSEPGLTLAEAMRDYLVECGVAPTDIVLEKQSSTTYENALYSAELLGDQPAQRVFLVTSAASMWRAESSFRKQGVNVMAAPCEFHAQRLRRSVTSALPSANAIAGVNDAVHEWVGLVWYWLRGRL
jgi:uncharacterized SAM-binding protein YcdF (DUF218 family)